MQPKSDSSLSALLFDFDGPICSVFAHFAAREVASKLVSGIGSLPNVVSQECDVDDPLEVLKCFSLNNPNDRRAVSRVDHLLSDLEVEAVASAKPTPGSLDLLDRLNCLNIPFAVVSNNSRLAIERFFYLNAQFIPPIVGRPEGKPELMKPNPFPLQVAAKLIGELPGNCVMIGDSVTDIEAAVKLGCYSVGFANSDYKVGALVNCGANSIVREVSDLRHLLARLLKQGDL